MTAPRSLHVGSTKSLRAIARRNYILWYCKLCGDSQDVLKLDKTHSSPFEEIFGLRGFPSYRRFSSLRDFIWMKSMGLAPVSSKLVLILAGFRADDRHTLSVYQQVSSFNICNFNLIACHCFPRRVSKTWNNTAWGNVRLLRWASKHFLKHNLKKLELCLQASELGEHDVGHLNYWMNKHTVDLLKGSKLIRVMVSQCCSWSCPEHTPAGVAYSWQISLYASPKGSELLMAFSKHNAGQRWEEVF